MRAATRAMLVLALASAMGAVSCRHPAPTPGVRREPDASRLPASVTGDMPRRPVSLLWPKAGGEGLVPRDAQIFDTASPVDQAKQLVGLLLDPPPDIGVVGPFPPGTSLRALFVDERGTAYVSLSQDVIDKATGGSTWEILAVNSLVGSLTRSVPSVHRVQILVEGREVETLTGHLDLRRPLMLDPGAIAP